jgi:hypothetical protein
MQLKKERVYTLTFMDNSGALIAVVLLTVKD